MTFFRRTIIAAATVATLAAPFAALSQDIKPRLIRFGYGLNKASNQGRAAKVFADAVDKASSGKMKVRAIGAAALGPDIQMQQALIGGGRDDGRLHRHASRHHQRNGFVGYTVFVQQCQRS